MGFPVILDATLPANTETPSLGASRIRALTQDLIDLFNLPAATNIAAALTITRVGPLTNNAGVTLNAGDVVALDAGNDASVVLSDVQGSLRQFVVALATITNASTGVFGQTGQVTVTVQGAVTRGNYLRKSATTKALEDTGVAVAAAATAPNGSVGVALTGAAGPGAGTVTALLFGVTAAPSVPTVTVVGGYQVRNLVGQNDATTPNTKYGYSADLVVLRNPSDGSTVVRTNTGTLTNDTGLAGSAANGRDQAGAFAASTWIRFYFIWNGTTLATLSSTVAPPTGPTLPTGYTHWAYAGAVRYNATPLLVKTRFDGSLMFYEVAQAGLTNGTATVETAVSLSTLVPPEALRVQLHVPRTVVANTDVSRVRVVTGSDFFIFDAAGGAFTGTGTIVIPNLGQQFFYLVTTGGSNLTVNVAGYAVPNGAE